MAVSNSMSRIFLWLALLGFVLSAAVHGFALAGVMPPLPQPQVFALQIGIFVVFVPAIFALRRLSRDGQAAGLNTIVRRSPPWVGIPLVLLFVYAVVNFILVFVLHPARHGAALTAAASLTTLRGFSGHWMLFYFASFAIHRVALQPDTDPSDPGADPPRWWNKLFADFGGD